MEKISTDFFKYGTFKTPDCDILKAELENAGLPVKAVYPGTNIGKEATAGALTMVPGTMPALTLMIRGCDYVLAEKIRKKLNMEAVKKGDKFAFWRWRWVRYSNLMLFELGLFLLGIFIGQKLEGRYTFAARDNWVGKWAALMLVIYLVTFGIWMVKGFKNWIKEKGGNYEEIDPEKDKK